MLKALLTLLLNGGGFQLKNKKFFVFVVLGVSFFFICAFQKVEEKISLISSSINLINTFYVEEVDPANLVYSALRGAVSSLDPYSEFLSPAECKDVEIDAQGSVAGIGVVLLKKDNNVFISEIILNSPAEIAGLMAGDKLLSIDKELVEDKGFDDIVNKIRGIEGSWVLIKIIRNENTKFVFNIKRKKVEIKSIQQFSLIDNNFLYVKLDKFQEKKTYKDLLEILNKEKYKGFIFDLRNNSGGILDAAIDIAELFLKKGQKIVSLKGRHISQNKDYTVKNTGKFEKLPMVVLINKNSASAAEVLAGAFSDNKRAILIGQNSFGKGSVQTLFPIGDCAIRLTTAKYLTPSGVLIDKKGIIPDIVLDQEVVASMAEKSQDIKDKCVLKAMEILKNKES